MPIIDCGFVDAVTSGRVRVVPAVTGFTDGAVRLADGSQVEVDAVLAATGYRTGLPPLVGHLGVLDERGMPLVSGGRTLPQAPRLHFIGDQGRADRGAAGDRDRVGSDRPIACWNRLIRSRAAAIASGPAASDNRIAVPPSTVSKSGPGVTATSSASSSAAHQATESG